MKKPRLLGAICACAFGLITTSTSAALITFDTWELKSRAQEGNTAGINNAVLVTNTTVTVPLSSVQTATHGPSTSQSTYDLSTSANSATMSVEFDHVRGGITGPTLEGSGDSYSESFGTIDFTVNTNTVYSLSGAYSQLASQQIEFRAGLVDNTLGTTLFFNRQLSNALVVPATNESFILGGIGGDTINTLEGSLTGILIASHTYTFTWDAYFQAGPNNDLGGTASGNVLLSVGAVPLPAAAWLFGSGLLGLIGMARRKKV